jgi:hypothetical protein
LRLVVDWRPGEIQAWRGELFAPKLSTTRERGDPAGYKRLSSYFFRTGQPEEKYEKQAWRAAGVTPYGI